MAGILLGVAFLMAALAAARAHAATMSAPSGGAGDLEDAARKVVATGDPAKMLDAATEAKKSGNGALADSLTARARDANVMSSSPVLPSPFPSVPTPVWSAFVRKMRGSNPHEITPAYHLGLFGFGMPKLVDLGLATNPHQDQYQGRKVWLADWLPPMTLESFLSSPYTQYQAFVKASIADLTAIHQKVPGAIGTEIDGKPATPSGLLAVVHQAGLANLEKWIADPEVRKKFPNTTAIFHKFNGMF